MPPQLKSIFRVVSLLEPDIEMILRVKCVKFIKGSNVLATRLKTIFDIFKGSQMSLQSEISVDIKQIYINTRIDL